MNVDSDGFNSTFSGNFSGSGGLAKSGVGTLTLTGASTYTGPTAVTTGALVLEKTSSHTASLGNTAITVANGATFSPILGASPSSAMVKAGAVGSGTAGATLTLAPGSTFSMADGAVGNFNLQQENNFSGPAFTIGGASGAAPTLVFDFGGPSAGTDQIDVTKTVSVLATGGKITVDALGGYSGLQNYDLIVSAGGFSGRNGNNFTLTTTTESVDGITYDFSLADSTTTDEILTVQGFVPAVRTGLASKTATGEIPTVSATPPSASDPVAADSAAETTDQDVALASGEHLAARSLDGGEDASAWSEMPAVDTGTDSDLSAASFTANPDSSTLLQSANGEAESAPQLTVAAVPEPSTNMSLLSVFGVAAGWLLRRRKRTGL